MSFTSVHRNDISLHRACIAGVCAECEGEREVECIHCFGTGDCECSCGDYHNCGKCDGTGMEDCDHCDGSGKCEHGPTQEQHDEAEMAWEAIVESLAPYAVTLKNFRRVFEQMFSRDANESEVAAWIEVVKPLADFAGKGVAGVNVSEPTSDRKSA